MTIPSKVLHKLCVLGSFDKNGYAIDIVYPYCFLQIQDTKFCFHRIFQNNPQSFLVEMWSDCSDSTLHQGPLMLEPIFLNSTMTLFIPHLHPNCHIIAGVQNHEVLNYSSNVTFCECWWTLCELNVSIYLTSLFTKTCFGEDDVRLQQVKHSLTLPQY